MVLSEMDKLISMRKKELELINSYGKNLNKNSTYFIHNNKIYSSSFEEDSIPGVFIASGFNFDLFYLNKKDWYLINGKELYAVLKDSIANIEILKDKIKIISKSMQYVITKAKKSEIKEFKHSIDRYLDNKSSNKKDITNYLIDNYDKSLPDILELEDETGETKKIRFIRKLIKTNYSVKNLIGANATLRSISEHLYIGKFTIKKLEGTKTKPITIKLDSIYGIVPLK